MPATFSEDFQAIVFGVTLMPIVIPWGYIYRHYVKQQADRWHAVDAPPSARVRPEEKHRDPKSSTPTLIHEACHECKIMDARV